MFAAQWHFDVPFGKQKEALDTMVAWTKDGLARGAKKPESIRYLVGHIGKSPSHIVCEYMYRELTDWESSHKAFTGAEFKPYQEKMANLIVPGSQHWTVWRVAETI